MTAGIAAVQQETDMNSRDRVRASFAHREPDRVPLFELSIDADPASALMGREMWVGGYGFNAVRANRMAAAGAGAEWAERQRRDTLDLWHALGLDAIVIPRPGRREGLVMETLGEYRWRVTDPLTGYWEEFAYEPRSDSYAQVRSSLDDAGEEGFERYVAALERIEHRAGDYDLERLDRWLEGAGDLFVLMGADVDFPPSSRSWAGLFMESLILRPDLVDRYLDAQMPARLLMIEEAFKRGVDGVLAGNDWASAMGPLISPAHMRRFILPRFRQIAGLCHARGKVLVKHTDGNIRRLERILFDECDVDGWHPVDPTAGLTVAEYKARTGDRITLIGNVNCATTLVSGTREDVIAETKAVIRAGAPGGGFILSSSNSIHGGVKPELYAAMLEAARAHGTYPIDEERLT
jgi:hypothetical protein